VRIVPSGKYSARVFDACGNLVATSRSAELLDLRRLERGVYMAVVTGAAPCKLVLR
jgi:hypothetical protein